MLDTHGRQKLDGVFDATAKQLLSIGLTPNAITTAALIIGLNAAIFLYFDWRILSISLLWLSGFLDAVDGSMARQSNQASLVGALFDIVSDRVVELSIFWALVLRHPDSQLAMLALVSSVLLSMTIFLTTGMLAINDGQKSFHYQAGLMERTEGFLASTVMILFQTALTPLTWIYTLLITITIGQRLSMAHRQLSMKNRSLYGESTERKETIR